MDILTTMLLTALITTLIYDSGFFEEMDKRVSKAFPLHHLPYPFHCCFCGTWWTLLFLIIVTGNLTIPCVLAALILARLTSIFSSVFSMVENAINKIIAIMNTFLW